MSDGPHSYTDDQQIDLAAAAWLVRRDASLTSEEQAELNRWLAADLRHRESWERHQQTWAQFDLLATLRPAAGAPDHELLAPAPHRSWFLPVVLAAAAAMVIGIFIWQRDNPRSVSPLSTPLVLRNYESRTLEDGSLVELNHGAIVEVDFTARERRVVLIRGEANFTVAKNPLRPFIVRAGAVDVRAVGTAFDVCLKSSAVEVLVTEGHVRVNSSSDTPAPEVPVLGAGQRAVVSLTPSTPSAVVQVSREEISRLLAWRPRLFDFTSAPLSEVVAQFNQCNRVQLIIADPQLRSLPIVASFRSDNVEGFVRLLKLTAGIRAERHGENEIVLLRKQ